RETPRILKPTEGARTMQKFYLVWDESRHALGIPSIDAEHRGLMALVNELSELVAHGSDFEQARRQMEKILDFAADHFRREEALMRRHGFPGLEQHAVEHEKLLHKATTLMETYDPEHADRAVLITAFLTDCAENHILHEDRAISQYFAERGIRAD
ncbi:MAG: bacteriohemerythrin, partial [Sulfurimicrobium sp.]|nr:bacteriohemerythrin [Sulfurimicrobium sp.]